MNHKYRKLGLARQYLLLHIGAILAAVGLEIFLVPNHIIDGGIVGISIIGSYLTNIPLGALIFILNLPFLFIGYQQIGMHFTIATLYSIISLSAWVTVLHPIPGLTQDMLLAAVFGGIILGIGVGLIIRYGGSLDGTEILAIIFNKRLSFSVGEIVMFFNLFILSSAGLVFGWDRAMYSLIAYFIAFKIIDITIEGLDETREVMIISDHPQHIAEGIAARLGRNVTFMEGRGGYSGDRKEVIYVIVTRLEITPLKAIVDDLDEDALVSISSVHEVRGRAFRKRAIH